MTYVGFVKEKNLLPTYETNYNQTKNNPNRGS